MTPGPWHVEKAYARWPGHESYDIYPPKDLAQGSRIPIARDVHPRDAALIAAAPELLALIQMAFDDPDSEVLGEDWNRRANAVIAKATGVQP